ncbi:MAG: ATP-binding protein [Firmicutes bacterium HGW-Firmicutes-7]|nr:MAG: ATP-binding protein [Firmicutes bacterium HGW-Firmicutes-7]
MKELSLHILDIAQNSVRAKAKNIEITVKELIKENILEFSIEDNGTGIPNEIFKTIKDPFTTSRTTRKVGLGIPFLNDTCILCSGHLDIQTEIGKGTILKAYMMYDHIDRPPLGDITSTIVGLVTSNEDINIHYRHFFNNNIFEFETNEIKDVVGEIPLADINIYQWMKEFVKENIQEIQEMNKEQ